MLYVVLLVTGLVGGASIVLAYLWDWRNKVQRQAREAESKSRQAQAALNAATVRETELASLIRDTKAWQAQCAGEISRENAAAATERRRMIDDAVRERDRIVDELNAERAEFKKKVISYGELQKENAVLKRDLQNIDVNLNKLTLDGELREKRQNELEASSNQLAKRYLAETVKSVVASVGPSNFAACKKRLVDVIERCREIGFAVPAQEEARLLAELTAEFELAVRAEFEREEQARIKAQVREEERLRREIDKELKQLERERLAVQAALDQALAEAKGQHTAEVQRLQQRLSEAEQKAQKTLSMAQQTKEGYVYVISNIGSFGPDVLKVGMTRRLNPDERVHELSGASVPFPFDILMKIRCKDAPSLENALHRALRNQRVNQANPRKEFFKATAQEVERLVAEHRDAEVVHKADAEALEYNQSLTMPDEDANLIANVYDVAEKEVGATGDED